MQRITGVLPRPRDWVLGPRAAGSGHVADVMSRVTGVLENKALMQENQVSYKPIGVIHSEHVAAEQTPIQPVYAKGCHGRAEILPEFMEGLRDLKGFSHIYLIYHFHCAGAAKLTVKPFLQDVERGLFATRAPCRPNAIGLSVVRLVKIEGTTLHLEDVDILDGTPLLDIKPYTAKFDRIAATRNGWQDAVDAETARKRGARGYCPMSGADQNAAR